MRVIVVGGGPAGMMAAIAAARRGAQVDLLEGNEKLGKKLYITGKGRCNLTNDCGADRFFENIVENPRFLYSAFQRFSNRDLMAFVEEAGVPLKVERGGRVFPVSDKASDITRALERQLRKAGVRVRLGERVTALQRTADGFMLQAEGTRWQADAVILATGGLSYPSTGSDGAGFTLARALGQPVTPLRPALTAMLTKEAWPKELTGLSLKNVALVARHGKKTLFEEIGELLFTHFGLSGPLALSLSSRMVDLPLDAVTVRIDMKPGLTMEQLDRRLLRDFACAKQLDSVLGGLLPRRLCPVAANLCGLAPETPVNQIGKTQRLALAGTLKALPVTISGFRPVQEAIVTRGGVDVRQVDPKTMRSKQVPNLYFAGEMLDVDGFTGGFNLQIAFSTGWCAGWAAGADNGADAPPATQDADAQ